MAVRLALFLLIVWFSNAYAKETQVIRVGHFPNITHAQAVIAHGLSRNGKGWFEERLGPDVEIQWFVYNAGPSAMEGIFSDSIDLTYVGPNPAINAFIRARGEEIRIICGACSGGAALVVQPDGRIKTNTDFKGKKVGTPQFGNTQDVAARAWLISEGYKVTMTGGDVLVIPTANPDQLAMFKTKDLDAVWTIEPWVSRLVLEGQGKIYFDESILWKKTDGKYVTTHLVSSVKYLHQRPELIKKWIAAQIELTQWIKEHPDEAKAILKAELKEEIYFALPADVFERAWKNLELTYDPIVLSLYQSGENAFKVGFLKEQPNLESIYQLDILHSILAEKKLPPVQDG
jgi:NitT/TauT family transport system substrate-binding protein